MSRGERSLLRTRDIRPVWLETGGYPARTPDIRPYTGATPPATAGCDESHPYGDHSPYPLI